MDIYNIQLYSIDMVLSECGPTGLWGLHAYCSMGCPYVLGLLNYARVPLIAQCGLHMSQVHLVESFLAGSGVDVFIVLLEFSRQRNMKYCHLIMEFHK